MDSISSSHSRYDRQSRIWGVEGQRKLENSRVLVCGSGILSEFVLSGLACLGVGNILFIGQNYQENGSLSFLASRVESDSYVGVVGGKLREFNDLIKFKFHRGSFSKTILDIARFRPELIIETSNNPLSKKKGFGIF